MNPSLVFITNPCVRRLEIRFHEEGMTACRLLRRLLCPYNSYAKSQKNASVKNASSVIVFCSVRLTRA